MSPSIVPVILGQLVGRFLTTDKIRALLIWITTSPSSANLGSNGSILGCNTPITNMASCCIFYYGKDQRTSLEPTSISEAKSPHWN